MSNVRPALVLPARGGALTTRPRTSLAAGALTCGLALVFHPRRPHRLVPAAGLHRVGALAEDMRRSGLKIDLRVSGERPVPPAVDLAAYRIVQESLTNVLRHAGSAAVILTLAHGPDALVLEITNTTPGTGHTIGDTLCPGGRGITGMSQRAVELGGTLHAGPLAQGGFRVQARLPATQVRTRSSPEPHLLRPGSFRVRRRR